MRPNRAQATAVVKEPVASRRLRNDALAEWKAHGEATGKRLRIDAREKRSTTTSCPDAPTVVTDQAMPMKANWI